MKKLLLLSLSLFAVGSVFASAAASYSHMPAYHPEDQRPAHVQAASHEEKAAHHEKEAAKHAKKGDHKKAHEHHKQAHEHYKKAIEKHKASK